jgi:hypothetical protein
VPGQNSPGWDIAVSDRVNRMLNGKMNVSDVTTVTLRPNETTTTLVDSRIGYFSVVGLEPITANAAIARASLWYETADGSATLHHASVAAADQEFKYFVLG